MADTNNPGASGTPTIPRGRDAQYRDVYANASYTTLTPFDITLTFSKNIDAAGQIMQLDQVSVTLSPQHFKALINSMIETLTAYENTFGKLTISQPDTAAGTSAEQIEAKIRAIRDASKRAARAAMELTAPSSTESKPPSTRSRASGKAKETKP